MLVPTEPNTPVTLVASLDMPRAQSSPLSPTPTSLADDSSDFAATFGPDANAATTNSLTLKLAATGDDDDIVATPSPSRPADDPDSPAGAVMTPTPAPKDKAALGRAVGLLLNSENTSAPTSTAPATTAPLALPIGIPFTGCDTAQRGQASTAASTMPAALATVQQPAAVVAGASSALQPSLLAREAGMGKEALAVPVASSSVCLRMVPGRAGGSGETAVASSSAVVRANGASSVSLPVPGGVGSASARLAEKMDITRIMAMGKEFWLAHGDALRAGTAFYRDGRADILVYRAAANAAREAQAAHAADPDAVAAPEAPGRAVGWTIGTIPIDRAYLQADGHFKGPNANMPFLKPFSQTTLSCALGPPPAEFPVLVGDYNSSLASLRSILPRGLNDRSGHVYQNLAGQHLRLRHSLFTPKSDGDEAHDEEPLPAHFTTAGWPTYSPAAAEALAAIADTHVVRPLPAFDLNGNLIHPSRYLAELRGATVLAGFTVTVYNISERSGAGRDNMRTNVCLDIDYLRVLIAPPQFAAKKRSAVHLTDPMSKAAGKKRCVMW